MPLVAGARVEYYSASNKCWMPVTVAHVDGETGNVTLDVKPNAPIGLDEQLSKFRPLTRPSRAQLQWLRGVLRDGAISAEAQAVFCRHARRVGSGHDAASPALVVQSKDLDTVGAEVDAKLGTSGSSCAFRERLRKEKGRALTAEAFDDIFWHVMWAVQREYGQALSIAPTRRAANFHDVYTLEGVLGKGTYGSVRLARDTATGETRAVKLVRTRDFFWGSTQRLDHEIEHLRHLDHPHIAKLYEHYEDRDYVYIVMDYCSGGDLEKMVKATRDAGAVIPERFVSEVMRQVLMAIVHVHARGIVHMDLKSANIMLMPSRSTLLPGRSSQGHTLGHINEKPFVMLIDLGVAQIFRPGDFRCQKPIGTPATMAPEVWVGEVTPKADVFSSGVVLFECLSLALPFLVPVALEGGQQFWRAPPAAPWDLLHHASDHAVDACKGMVVQDRHRRPTAAQCLQMDFLRRPDEAGQGEHAAAIRPKMVQLLTTAVQRSVLHKSVALSIARAWPANQLPSIRNFFHELDTAGTGQLSKAQMASVFERFGTSEREAREIADSLDLDRDGIIHWTEFVAACIQLSSDDYEEDLQRIFKEADSDGDGLLSKDDIATMLAGDHLRHDAVNDVFVDLVGRTDPGARVDWPTFRQYFRLGSANGSHPSGAKAARAEVNGRINDFVEQARSLYEMARDAIWPDQEDCGEPPEEVLKQLAEMGFSDRGKCVAVLRKHRNKLSDRVFRELL